MAERSIFRLGRRRQRGESIVEGMLSMLLLCLILFGLLQIFQMTVAQMFSQYAAFKTVWAAGLGYSDEYLRRVALTSMAGASGRMTNPGENYGSMLNLSRREIEIIPGSVVTEGLGLLPGFRAGQHWVDYQYWHTDQNSTGTYCMTSSPDRGSNMVSFTAGFAKYPLNMPMRRAFIGDDTVDITSTASMRDSSSIFINDD